MASEVFVCEVSWADLCGLVTDLRRELALLRNELADVVLEYRRLRDVVEGLSGSGDSERSGNLDESVTEVVQECVNDGHDNVMQFLLKAQPGIS